jgi:hypothetical protein
MLNVLKLFASFAGTLFRFRCDGAGMPVSTRVCLRFFGQGPHFFGERLQKSPALRRASALFCRQAV